MACVTCVWLERITCGLAGYVLKSAVEPGPVGRVLVPQSAIGRREHRKPPAGPTLAAPHPVWQPEETSRTSIGKVVSRGRIPPPVPDRAALSSSARRPPSPFSRSSLHQRCTQNPRLPAVADAPEVSLGRGTFWPPSTGRSTTSRSRAEPAELVHGASQTGRPRADVSTPPQRFIRSGSTCRYAAMEGDHQWE
jgi:hypothetical protein